MESEEVRAALSSSELGLILLGVIRSSAVHPYHLVLRFSACLREVLLCPWQQAGRWPESYPPPPCRADPFSCPLRPPSCSTLTPPPIFGLQEGLGTGLVVPSRSQNARPPLLSADLIHRAGSRLFIVAPSDQPRAVKKATVLNVVCTDLSDQARLQWNGLVLSTRPAAEAARSVAGEPGPAGEWLQQLSYFLATLTNPTDIV